MKRLEETVKPHGTGISGLRSTLVKRTERVAMYLRNDGYYETGIVKVIKTDNKLPNGIVLPAGEYYWGNEDFGDLAKTTSKREIAEKHYSYFLSRLEDI